MANATNNPYLRDAVMTATPEQLQLMLYDGAIRFALQARDAIQKRDYETSCDRLTKAQRILLDMQSGLNVSVNPELCGRVAAIYGFIYRKLVDANVHRDTAAIDDAMKVLRIERETWQILVDKVQRAAGSPGDGDSHGPEAADLPTAQDAATGSTGEANATLCVEG